MGKKQLDFLAYFPKSHTTPLRATRLIKNDAIRHQFSKWIGILSECCRSVFDGEQRECAYVKPFVGAVSSCSEGLWKRPCWATSALGLRPTLPVRPKVHEDKKTTITHSSVAETQRDHRTQLQVCVGFKSHFGQRRPASPDSRNPHVQPESEFKSSQLEFKLSIPPATGHDGQTSLLRTCGRVQLECIPDRLEVPFPRMDQPTVMGAFTCAIRILTSCDNEFQFRW